MERGLDLLRVRIKFLLAQDASLANLAHDRPLVPHRLYDVAGASLALCADEGRAFRDSTKRFTEVTGTAHERDFERVLVNVVLFVRRGQDLRLIDVVDANGLQDLFVRTAY